MGQGSRNAGIAGFPKRAARRAPKEAAMHARYARGMAERDAKRVGAARVIAQLAGACQNESLRKCRGQGNGLTAALLPHLESACLRQLFPKCSVGENQNSMEQLKGQRIK